MLGRSHIFARERRLRGSVPSRASQKWKPHAADYVESDISPVFQNGKHGGFRPVESLTSQTYHILSLKKVGK